MWNHRGRGRRKIVDSVVMINGNVAEFVWFELKEAETKLREYSSEM